MAIGSSFKESTAPEAATLQRIQDVCGRCENGQWRGRTCKFCGGSGRRWADPIGDAVRDLVKDLHALERYANSIAGKTTIVMGAADRWRGRQSALQGTCQVPACGRVVAGVGEDRLKGGMCNRCYLHYTSWKLVNAPSGDPGADRQVFFGYMAKWLEAKAQKEREKADERPKARAR